jgi:transcription antitermination factor NusG
MGEPTAKRGGSNLSWYAVYTRSRHEKAVEKSLGAKGLEAFLPLHEVLSQWKDRKRWVQKPLFPGYLFVRAPGHHLGLVWMQRGVVHGVSDGRGAVPVPDEQVEAVRGLLARPVPVDPWPYVTEGQRVIVRAGPLIGLEGFFVSRKNESKLVVSIDMLGRSVAAEVQVGDVEPMGVSIVHAS